MLRLPLQTVRDSSSRTAKSEFAWLSWGEFGFAESRPPTIKRLITVCSSTWQAVLTSFERPSRPGLLALHVPIRLWPGRGVLGIADCQHLNGGLVRRWSGS